MQLDDLRGIPVLLDGPPSERLPTNVAGTYLVILRIEATNDKEADSDLSLAGAGQGIIHSGGIAGFAKGGADVTLAEDGPDATILTYAAKADVGGKIAQLGSRLITSTSKKLAGEFFSSFGQKVAKG